MGSAEAEQRALGRSIEWGVDILILASVGETNRTDLTYNLTIADFETYFVGKERVLVHNCRRGGETAATREGRRAHALYGERARQEGLRSGRDARLPSGREPDAIDDENRVVQELKPDNSRAIAKGNRQVEGYRRELEEATGKSWTGEVDTYRPRPQ